MPCTPRNGASQQRGQPAAPAPAPLTVPTLWAPLGPHAQVGKVGGPKPLPTFEARVGADGVIEVNA